MMWLESSNDTMLADLEPVQGFILVWPQRNYYTKSRLLSTASNSLKNLQQKRGNIPHKVVSKLPVAGQFHLLMYSWLFHEQFQIWLRMICASWSPLLIYEWDAYSNHCYAISLKVWWLVWGRRLFRWKRTFGDAWRELGNPLTKPGLRVYTPWLIFVLHGSLKIVPSSCAFLVNDHVSLWICCFHNDRKRPIRLFWRQDQVDFIPDKVVQFQGEYSNHSPTALQTRSTSFAVVQKASQDGLNPVVVVPCYCSFLWIHCFGIWKKFPF